MDILLVNSGPCDFFKPKTPLSNALYKNNRDGTFTDVTAKGRRHRRSFRTWASPLATTITTACPTSSITAYGQPDSVPQQRRRDVHGRHREGRTEISPAGRPARVWFDYDGDGLLDLFLCSFVEYGREYARTCGDNKLGPQLLLHPARFQADRRAFCITTTATEHSRKCSKGTDIAKALGKGLGVVATDINNDGRMDLFVANDTVQNFLFVNRGAAASGKRSRSPPRSASATTARRVPAWASTPPTSTATAGRISSSPTSIRRCSHSTGTTRTRHSATWRTQRNRAGDPAAKWLGTEVLRLR